MDIAVNFRVTGQVQGVAFRAWTRGQAEAAGLRGWVRNEPDGSVTGHLEGPEADVEAMVTQLFSGPGAARVQDVSHRRVPPEGLTGFGIRR